jgi:hypothetical protein
MKAAFSQRLLAGAKGACALRAKNNAQAIRKGEGLLRKAWIALAGMRSACAVWE